VLCVCIAIGAQLEGMARTTSTPQKSRRCLPSSSYLFTTLLIRWLEEHNRFQLDSVRKSKTVGQQSINMAFSDEIPGKAASLLTVVIE
jgi:hypothetical protein